MDKQRRPSQQGILSKDHLQSLHQARFLCEAIRIQHFQHCFVGGETSLDPSRKQLTLQISADFSLTPFPSPPHAGATACHSTEPLPCLFMIPSSFSCGPLESFESGLHFGAFLPRLAPPSKPRTSANYTWRGAVGQGAPFRGRFPVDHGPRAGADPGSTGMNRALFFKPGRHTEPINSVIWGSKTKCDLELSIGRSPFLFFFGRGDV